MTSIESTIATLPEKSLLLLDDDAPLRNRLGRALESRGFQTTLVESVSDALSAVRSRPPAFAVLDMRLEDGSGLKVVEALREARPDARIVRLTGYGTIATAVAAVKAGAVVEFRNGRRGGAIVSARWKRSRIEAPPLGDVAWRS